MMGIENKNDRTLKEYDPENIKNKTLLAMSKTIFQRMQNGENISKEERSKSLKKINEILMSKS
jgi:hypothetical protein